MKVWGMAVALLAVGVAVASCNDDEPASPVVQHADAYSVIVQWVATETLEPVEDGRPVVYVMSADGSTIDAGVQAEVARNTVDDIDVRFADERDQAIDDSDETGTVRDGGVLLMVASPPDAAPTMVVDVDLYRDAATATKALTFRLRAAAAGVSVTSVTDRASG